MTIRTWFYGKLMESTLVSERVFAKKSMTSSVETCPYLVYKFGFGASEGLSETVDPERQFAQVWIHDFSDGEVANYDTIDEVIEELKGIFKLASSKEDGVIAIRWLETSQDLNDETLNTVFKYMRFQMITEGVTS